MQMGKIAGITHLYAGQEAIAVGVCSHLSDADWIISTHRGHGHALAKGCDVVDMMKELFGSTEGLCGGKGGTMHIADLSKGMLGANAVVGAGPPIALGAALSSKMRGDGGVAVSFTGDGGTNQGTVFEALNMAVVLKVPKLFVFENNGYGEMTGAEFASGGVDVASRTEGFGMPVFRADGTDFHDVYEQTGLALEHIRSGQGPATLWADGTRFFGHFYGDPQAYRAPGEVEDHRANKDCLKKFRERAQVDGAPGIDSLDQIDQEVLAIIDQAVQLAGEAARPTPADVLTDVYVSYP